MTRTSDSENQVLLCADELFMKVDCVYVTRLVIKVCIHGMQLLHFGTEKNGFWTILTFDNPVLILNLHVPNSFLTVTHFKNLK